MEPVANPVAPDGVLGGKRDTYALEVQASQGYFGFPLCVLHEKARDPGLRQPTWLEYPSPDTTEAAEDGGHGVGLGLAKAEFGCWRVRFHSQTRFRSASR